MFFGSESSLQHSTVETAGQQISTYDSIVDARDGRVEEEEYSDHLDFQQESIWSQIVRTSSEDRAEVERYLAAMNSDCEISDSKLCYAVHSSNRT